MTRTPESVAIVTMLINGYRPHATFTAALDPWPCTHMQCGTAVEPTLQQVQRSIRPLCPTCAPVGKHVGMQILMEEAGTWVKGSELDHRVTTILGRGAKQRAAFLIADKERGTHEWSADGHAWRLESRKDSRNLWLRAVRMAAL